jgi:putative ABC transport system permease protein
MRLLVLNLLRKPLRTFLTIFGLSVALFLFCFIESVIEAFNAGVNMASASRLVVSHRESLGFLLPMSYRQMIKQVEGVADTSAAVWFGGTAQETLSDGHKRDEFFPQFAEDLESTFKLYPEIVIPPDQFEALLADRGGCVLGDKIAQRLNKKVGDKLTLKSSLWVNDRNKADNSLWDFTVRAIYTTDSPSFDRTMMLFHWTYLDEARTYGNGTTGIFIIGMSDPTRYAEICKAIDDRFANTPYETRTQTEKAFNMQFVSMMGNFKLLFRSIGSAVALTMLLVSANTMMMSARERTREMGILKSIGFTDMHVFFLLVGEAMLIAALGGLLGAGGAYWAFNTAHINPKADFFPVFYLPLGSFFTALVIAAGTGLISGLVPAINGMRLKATDALRSV